MLNSHFNVCKKCKNRVQVICFGLYHYTLPDSGLEEVVVCGDEMKKNVVIHDGEERLREAGPYTVADIHCVECNDLIGYKFVAGPTTLVKEGDVLLILKRLEQAAIKKGQQPDPEEAADQDQAAEVGEQEYTPTKEEPKVSITSAEDAGKSKVRILLWDHKKGLVQLR